MCIATRSLTRYSKQKNMAVVAHSVGCTKWYGSLLVLLPVGAVVGAVASVMDANKPHGMLNMTTYWNILLKVA